MGALYLGSKLEECPVRMRDLINVYDLLLSRARHSSQGITMPFKYSPMSYFSSTFYDFKDALVVAEMQILKRLGFNVHVVLPYGTLVNYLRVLSLLDREDVCRKAWGYLNDAYVLYLHCRPNMRKVGTHRCLIHIGYKHPFMSYTRFRQLFLQLYSLLVDTCPFLCHQNLQTLGGCCLMSTGKICGAFPDILRDSIGIYRQKRRTESWDWLRNKV